jgi:hypothetical protein
LKLSTPFNTLTGAWTMRGQKTLVQPRSKACLREKPSAEGDKWRQIRGGKRRQIATSSLPLFAAI